METKTHHPILSSNKTKKNVPHSNQGTYRHSHFIVF
jgi:hypothetical protein